MALSIWFSYVTFLLSHNFAPPPFHSLFLSFSFFHTHSPSFPSLPSFPFLPPSRIISTNGREANSAVALNEKWQASALSLVCWRKIQNPEIRFQHRWLWIAILEPVDGYWLARWEGGKGACIFDRASYTEVNFKWQHNLGGLRWRNWVCVVCIYTVVSLVVFITKRGLVALHEWKRSTIGHPLSKNLLGEKDQI